MKFTLSTILGGALLLASATLASSASASSPATEIPPTGHFDARTAVKHGLSRAPSADQLAARRHLGRTTSDLAVGFDPATGVARSIGSRTDLLTEARPGVDPEQIAIEHIVDQRRLLGLAEADLLGLELVDRVYSSVSGATHLHFRQTHDGIPVYQGMLRISVNRDGRVISLTNAFVPELAAAVNGTTPSVEAAQAVLRGAESYGFAGASLPKALTPSKGLSRRLELYQPVLSSRRIETSLVWLPIRPGEARLAWHFNLDRSDLGHSYELTVDAETGRVWTRFDQIADAQYRVYPAPVESPHHTSPLPPADARVLVVDPHDTTASPLGWHDTGSSSYTTLVGNNVTTANGPGGNCGVSLDCDFSLDLTAAPTSSASAGAANAFYWVNHFHDVQYHYGFDEAAGNFQTNNFGNGGVGGDPVDLRVQTAQTCNGNFAGGTDGSPGVLRLYYCNGRDGALDNGVTLHEVGHGLNRRLVGGPSTDCLSNTQSPDEGWSDWLGLVYTSEVGDAGTDGRGIGSWLIGGTPNDTIRSQLFSTDPAVNTFTFGSLVGKSAPYGTGEIWTQALWEVFWALVDQRGFDPDLFDLAAGAGNHRALFYVTEGMKLTPCSPTFLEARDAILQAATDNHSGEDLCTVWGAFAAFGMGVDAGGGSSNNTQVTEGFALPAACGGTGNTPPAVTVLLPSNGATFTAGDTVSFSGSATDAEDGTLTSALSWSSSLDGALGTGGSFSSSSLSVGTHTITASVTDSGGAPGSDSVQITVQGVCAPKGASCNVNSDCCSNRCRGGGSKACK